MDLKNTKTAFKFIRTAILTILFISQPWTSAGWNARYFDYSEKDVYDIDELRVSIADRNWRDYYYPFYTAPSPFNPSSFMSPTLVDCHGFCARVPFPYVNSLDCRDVCNCRASKKCRARNNISPLRRTGLPSQVVPVYKGHNWIVNFAIWKLKEYGLWFSSISDEEIKYIHYGVSFADHPWIGRPDAVDANEDYVVGIWDLEANNLRGAVFDRDSFMNKRYMVETAFRGGTFSGRDFKGRANLYLSARYRAALFNEDRTMAADVMFHFPNKDSVNPRERAILLRSMRGVDKDHVFEKCDVSAMAYGVVLYQLSRKFWPDNETDPPDLYALPRVFSHKGPGSPETGAITIDHLFGPGSHVERAYLPSTYLGGNPFICAPPEPHISPKRRKNDVCRWGKPTWPIWVPDYERFDPRSKDDCFSNTCVDKLDRSCLVNPSCVEDFHRSLKTRHPPQSKKAALIYLGWALHMAQDLSMPRHAANWVGTVHDNIEIEADRIIRLGFGALSAHNGGWADWSPFEKESNRLFGGGKSRDQICQHLGLNDISHIDDSRIKELFDAIRDDAFRDRNLINGKKNGQPNQRKKYIQLAFQRAILASMKLMACLQPPHVES
ncbi:MAG: hypothetical protein GY866_06550 [Proteobacteria bacterium]|nr:hypothetical protein [Pseudomonadota bacterium]